MIAETLGCKPFRLTCAEPRWTVLSSSLDWTAVTTFVHCVGVESEWTSPTQIMPRITGQAMTKGLQSLQLGSVLYIAVCS